MNTPDVIFQICIAHYVQEFNSFLGDQKMYDDNNNILLCLALWEERRVPLQSDFNLDRRQAARIEL